MLLDDDFPQKTRLTLTRCSLSPQGQTTVESDEFSAMINPAEFTLDRAISYGVDLYDALKIGLISMDSTMRSNLGVGMPITQPSLGTLIRIGNQYLSSGSWWLIVFPAIQLGRQRT